MTAIIGTLLLWIGVALVLLGSFAFLVAAFRESVIWGLLVLFVSPCGLIFLVLHWSRARNSFFLMLWGWGFMALGALAFHANLPWPLS
jgi:hypothetical protein